MAAAAAVVLIALALAAVGPWSGQARVLIGLLGWMAAVAVGGWAYRGSSARVRPATRLLLVLAVVSLAGAAALFYISLQVRDILAGSVIFGASGNGCEVASEARSFSQGEPVYQVAHLRRSAEPGEIITLLLVRDGVREVLASESSPRTFDCLGGPLRLPGPGRYELEVRATDEILASGSLEVVAEDR